AFLGQRHISRNTRAQHDDHDRQDDTRHPEDFDDEVEHDQALSSLAEGASAVVASTAWPAVTFSCPTVITSALSGRPVTHTPSRVSLTMVISWNATMPFSTVRTPNTPSSFSVSTDCGSRCPGAVPSVTTAWAVTPSRIDRSSLSNSISTGNERVALSATEE